MDVLTYAAVCDVCARLAGRLSDDQLGAARDFYSVGEWELAEATLLVGLAHEGVGITREERELIRSTLDDPDSPDLDGVPIVEAVPPLPYRFAADGPPGAPDPARADAVLSAEAPRHGGRRLDRAWRRPLDGARDGATWVYVLRVAAGGDELLARTGLTSRLWGELGEDWQLEGVAEGGGGSPYQAAALSAARRIWTA